MTLEIVDSEINSLFKSTSSPIIRWLIGDMRRIKKLLQTAFPIGIVRDWKVGFFSMGLLYCRSVNKIILGSITAFKFMGSINHLGRMKMKSNGNSVPYFMGTLFSGITNEAVEFTLCVKKRKSLLPVADF